ncbi:MAG: DUF5667 domain-containing protein [Dehalococcoidales bacterium]|nr:DUF5667 domain-containing protein [Dehalococcoidales bacterium]
MKGSKEFNNILDECLERLLVKGATIEQCLRSYPEQASELEPLLEMALAVKKASDIQPRPEFITKARYQFRSALQEIKPKRRLFLGWQPQWAMVVAIILVLLLVGGGTVAAAGNSMPDNPLYPVKLATEQVQLTLTRSNMGKAELHAKLADRRVAEIVYIVNKGKPEKVEQLTQRLDNRLAMIASLALAEREGEVAVLPAPALLPPAKGRDEGVYPQANRRAELRMLLGHYAVNHPAALHAVLEKAPESAKPALLRAIAISEAGYEKAINALD